jgi:murein DD-endopeptidase MepM/ murein hydrolase activator NlpD
MTGVVLAASMTVTVAYARAGEFPVTPVQSTAISTSGSTVAATQLQRIAAISASRDRRREVRQHASMQRRIHLDRWVRPVTSYLLTAGFDDGGSLWSTGRHTGQDFAAPIGTPVYAATRGTIVSASYDGAYGNKLVIAHPDGARTWYCHLELFVRTSGRVRAGELVGRIGITGNTTGPHLHFEVHPHGRAAVDPVIWLRDHHVAV